MSAPIILTPDDLNILNLGLSLLARHNEVELAIAQRARNKLKAVALIGMRIQIMTVRTKLKHLGGGA